MEELLEYYQQRNFQAAPIGKYDQLALTPDFVFEKDNIVHAIVNRTSDTLAQSIIQRFATTKRIASKSLEIFFLFNKKPSLTILRDCKLFGVGILYLSAKNTIEIYAESKIIKGRQARPALPKTQIFFCSRQHLDERLEAQRIVDDQRDSLKVPIFPMLVENDQEYSHDIRDLWPIIEKCMDASEYVLVILSGELREIIDREARRALENYDPEELLFYVKSDKETKEAYSDLLTHATEQGVKFQEYFDLRGFRLVFNARLMKVIKRMHDDNDVPFLEGL
ncbi:MAG TPA: hypothetical protein VHB54_03565 [Mucilaginibacter sp.]|nr:hypothetical protein [Mucilaginibacter sp.]